MIPSLPWVTCATDVWDVLAGHLPPPDVGAVDLTIIGCVMSVKEAGRLRGLLDAGVLRRLRVVMSREMFAIRQSAPDGQASNLGDIERILGRHRLRGAHVHMKAFAWRSEGGSGCLLTSANLNHNTRPEAHMRADGLRPAVEEMADAVFDGVPEGISPPPPAGQPSAGWWAREASKRLIAAAAAVPGVVVETAGAAALVPGVHITERLGAFDQLDAIIRQTGLTRLWISTWSLRLEHINRLERLAEDGVDVRIWLPARFMRRSENNALYGRAAAIARLITWSPTHAKLLAASGPRGGCLVAGCANLRGLPAVDLHTVHIGREAAEHGFGLLADLPTEEAPEMPDPVPLEVTQKTTTRQAPSVRERPDHAGWSLMLSSVVSTAMAQAGLVREPADDADDGEGGDDGGDMST